MLLQHQRILNKLGSGNTLETMPLKERNIFFRSINLASLFTLAILFLLSCSADERESKMIFRYNESAGISSLDPAFARNQANMWMIHQLYNTLVEVDDSLLIKPALAKSWKISDDGKEMVFTLRSDVYFHDDQCFPKGKGRKFSASDVVYSFHRITDPATASPGAWIFNERVAQEEPFSAPDDSTFILRLGSPFIPMLGILTMPYCSIVPEEAVSFYGINFRRNPVGTGPFRIVNWVEGQALVCSKNKYYYEKDEHGAPLPYLDGIFVTFYDSKATEFLQFRQKKIDFINDIDASFKDEVITRTGKLRKEWQGSVMLNKHAYFNTEYLGILMDSMKTGNSALRKKKIRQAINIGIDRAKMMLYLRNSIGSPATGGFVPRGLPSFDGSSRPYPYDPQKARQLLKDAGYDATSQKIRLITIPQYGNLGVYIVRELEQIGLKLEIEVVPKNLLLQQTAASQAEFFRGSWIADYPDAENYLSVFFGRNPAPPNYTRFKNPQFDLWYEKAVAESDSRKRYELYRKMDSLIMEEAPIVPLWYDEVIHLVQNYITGFKPNGLNLLELRRAKRFKN